MSQEIIFGASVMYTVTVANHETQTDSRFYYFSGVRLQVLFNENERKCTALLLIPKPVKGYQK